LGLSWGGGTERGLETKTLSIERVNGLVGHVGVKKGMRRGGKEMAYRLYIGVY